jgi:hypothetical protein
LSIDESTKTETHDNEVAATSSDEWAQTWPGLASDNELHSTDTDLSFLSDEISSHSEYEWKCLWLETGMKMSSELFLRITGLNIFLDNFNIVLLKWLLMNFSNIYGPVHLHHRHQWII